MFFDSVNSNRLRKEINRLLSKGIFTYKLCEKNWHWQNFDFQGLKNLSPAQFSGAPSHQDIVKF